MDIDSERMSGGEAIVRSLLGHGIDTIFALPGAQTYALFDALHAHREEIRCIGARHEQGVAYMALGYAKSTGRVGVYSVVPGPGFLNTTAALCSAYSANSPVLCITGQVPSAFIGSGRGHLHELPDQLATLRLLTKWAARVEHPAQIPGLMDEAFAQMLGGRQRPVALEIPWDVLLAAVPVAVRASKREEQEYPLDQRAFDEALELIRRARRPMIMVGSGAMAAGQRVLELAELIQAPVVSFRSGRGVVSDESAYSFNCAAGYRYWRNTDLLIGIGSRLELQHLRWKSRPPDLKIMRIDIDPTEMVRLKPTVGIVGDAQAVTAELSRALLREGLGRPSIAAELLDIKRQADSEASRVQPQLSYLNAIRQVLPRNGFFVDELSQVGFASYFGFPVYEPRTFVTCGYQGTLGFGFPTALGVAAGNPGQVVVSVTGDGGFLFGVQELATAVQYGLNVVTIVFNNNAYGNVLRDQREKFQGHVIGAQLKNPDFVKLAESFGAAAYRAHTPEQLRECLERAIVENRPAVIEVPIEQGSEVSPWPILMPDG